MKTRHLYALMIAAWLAVPSTAFSQEQPTLREKANLLFQKYEYANAAVLYTKLMETRKPRLEDLEQLAYCYMQMKDYEAAEQWYAQLIAMKGSSPENLMHYGEALKANGKYEEAKLRFQQYVSQTNDYRRAEVLMAGCDSALIWMENPTVHQLRNEEVNTDLAEFSAFPVGNKVWYAGEPDAYMRGVGQYGWTGHPFLRVYAADRAPDNTLSNAVMAVESINNGDYHIGPVAATADGKTLYVTRTYMGEKAERTKEERRRFLTSKLELYVYTENWDGTWSSKPFAHNNVQEYSVGHAAVARDGSTLYFVSDMPGGYGRTDIWYCEKQADGNWGPPVNAGPTINTGGDEQFPNIGPDSTLYFSSDGFAGMGGLDVFQSTGSRQQWTTPRNLRYPVNSPADDFAYLINYEDEDGIAGYLSSNRSGGVGSDDIYSFTFMVEKPEPEPEPIILLLRGTVSNRNTGVGMPAAEVLLYNRDNNEVIERGVSDNWGRFEFAVGPDSNYRILAQREKFFPDSTRVSTVDVVKSDTLEVALSLRPVFSVGQTFRLENIHYDFDKHHIRPDAALILNDLVRTMRDHPTLKIELSSHTDSRGNDAYNMALSQRRAQAAVDYIVSQGIARNRLIAKGYGETKLVNHCVNGVTCSDEEHQANRRTEVTVLEY